MLPERRTARPLRTAAATVQIGLGLVAVLLGGFAVASFVDPSSVDAARGLFAGVCIVLGGTLFGIWMAARTRRGWLLVLAVVCGSLAVSMTTITARRYAPVRVDDQTGIWTAIALAAIDVLFWLLIAVAAVVEWRAFPAAAAGESRRVIQATAIVAPLAVITAFVLLLVSAGPGWLIRLNSEVSEVAPAVDGQGSDLTGDVRWTVELDAAHPAVAFDAGVAVPVPRDQDHSAGVIMIDPVNGQPRWRYQLDGAEEAPELAATDGGRQLVVTLGDVDEDVVKRTFTLDAESGTVQSVWPEVGEVMGTDPPVLFDHVARGTNSVIAISPTGRKLWTHQPERCADPRSVTSTPSVMLVRARRCDEGYPALQLLGLDARTGEQRWVRDVPQNEEGDPEGGEDGPGDVVVGDGYQVELSGKHLARRNLDTGDLDWTETVAPACSWGDLLRASETTYVSCGGGDTDEPTRIAAYATQAGRSGWERQLDQPSTAVAAVDDSSVLALTRGPESCTLQVVGEPGSTPLMEFPGGYQSADWQPGDVDCGDAELLRVGNDFVLQVRLVGDSMSSAERYRFIGLA